MDFQKLLDASQNTNIDVAFKQEEEKNKGYKPDTRYLKLNKKDEVGKITLRFLPHLGGKYAFVKRYSHFITYEGTAGKKYYIENNRTSLQGGEEDPMSIFNQKLWDKYNATKDEYYKDLAKMTSPRTSYISLVYVVNDPFATEKTDNTGKVKLYSYGKEIFGKLMDARNSENDFGPITPINPFSIADDGCNFGLILRRDNPDNKKEFPNYSKSEFLRGTMGALFGGDKEALKNMMEMNKDSFFDIYDEIEDKPENFKSYEELEQRAIRCFGDVFIDVMGNSLRAKGSAKAVEKDFEIEDTTDTGTVETPKPKAVDIDDEIPDFDAPKKEEETSEQDELAAFFQ